MLKKTLSFLLVLTIFTLSIHPCFAVEKTVELTTYYPSPNGDFKVLRADTVVGSDNDYYKVDGSGNVISGVGTVTGYETPKLRIKGSNADYLDGLSSSSFVEHASEFCLPWLMFYADMSFSMFGITIDQISQDALDCGERSYVKGFLYFRPALAVSLCETINALCLLFGITVDTCSFLGDIRLGVSGIGLCCSYKADEICKTGGDLYNSMISCKNFFTGLGLWPGYCNNMLDAFDQCAAQGYTAFDIFADSAVQDVCTKCYNMTWKGGWFGLVCWLSDGVLGCCLNNTKEVCKNKMSLDLDARACVFCPIECTAKKDCYWTLSSAACGSACYNCGVNPPCSCGTYTKYCACYTRPKAKCQSSCTINGSGSTSSGNSYCECAFPPAGNMTNPGIECP